MNDHELNSLLRHADDSAGPMPVAPPDLVVRARNEFQARRARARTRTLAVTFLSCYGMGLLTMWLVLNLTSSQTTPVEIQHSVKMDAHPDLTQQSPLTTVAVPALGPNAHSVATAETARKVSAYSVWCKLGNLCLERHQFEMALDYFARALEVATNDELRISDQEENWLLTSLKKERLASSRKIQKGSAI